jgi:NAD(P)-dependent dehydrogenase (short-subunit alcohol dehydrogenase family)
LKRPDLRPLDVNLVGTIYAIMLFKHFVRKSGRSGGKVVITASRAGQYRMPSHLIYCTSKHGASNISLTRKSITNETS